MRVGQLVLLHDGIPAVLVLIGAGLELLAQCGQLLRLDLERPQGLVREAQRGSDGARIGLGLGADARRTRIIIMMRCDSSCCYKLWSSVVYALV